MPTTRRQVLSYGLASASAGLMLSSRLSASERYPARPVTIINQFAPGSISDAAARLLAQSLHEQLGQPFIVENRVGAGGLLAATTVARAKPDGYTLLATASSLHSGAALYKELPIDPMKDFTHIARIGSYPSFIAVRSELPIATIKELVTYAKSKGGKMTYGHGNNMGRMIGEIFKLRTGAPLTRVPYRSNPTAMTDLVGGQIDMMLPDQNTGMPHVKSGRARPLAVFTKERSRVLPDVPTLDETVMPGFDVLPWGGLSGPANMPPEVVATLEQAVEKMLSDPKMQKQFRTAGVEVFWGGHKEFETYVRDQLTNWTALIKEAGIPPQ